LGARNSGLAFYSGDKFPNWKNNVFVGSLRQGEVPRSGHIDRVDFNDKWEELHRESIFRDLHALVVLLSINAFAFAQKRAITHEDIWAMKRAGEPVVSPDGRSIVFLLTEPDYDAAKQSADVPRLAFTPRR
jgi:hypothetical protein